MLSTLLRVGAFTAVMAVLPLTVSAQQADTASDAAAAAPAAPTELEQIQTRLAELQRQAMQDPDVRAANDSLSAFLEGAMAKADPNYVALAERAETLKTDVATAREAQDNERLHELATEAQQLQQGIVAIRNKAMADPAVQERFNAFKVTLFQKMTELDPKAPELVQRLTELSS